MFKKKLLIIITAVILIFAAVITVFGFVGNNQKVIVPEQSSYKVKQNYEDPSLKFQINDDICITVGIANECVGAICYLAGYEEYSMPDNDKYLVFNTTTAYVSKFKNKRKVKAAVKYYKKLREKGFCYDAPAMFATYITPDCRNWRTDYHTVKSCFEERYNGLGINFCNLDKLIKVTADFYDAVDFENFYKEHLDMYKRILVTVKSHSSNLNNIDSCFKDYFHHGAEGTVLNFSVFEGRNNYGTSFISGGKSYFEPKYGNVTGDSLFNNLGVIIHELCHPESNPMAEKLYKNQQIQDYLKNYLTGDRKQKLIEEAYPDDLTYLRELITRGNTVRILSKFMSESYVTNYCISADFQQGFDAVTDVAEMLKEYETGNYDSFADFEEKLAELYICKFCN